ncbi:ABC transporter permease [Luteimonas aquatica]|uniref:ABC transporter permease n=1 Tax=Luteimonas aquatica TaxID=450364 RepID=UPI001F582F89|nr:ABC transporter permease [Luteimonas aquatica]
MFRYYCYLALRSFRKHKFLTCLAVLAIAIGVGACATTLTVFHVLSRDPIPGKSHLLFHPQLDAEGMERYLPGAEPIRQLTVQDAEALLRDRRGTRQAMMTSGRLTVEPEDRERLPFFAEARYTSADFFALFDVPFRYGSGWSADDDEARARVAVISRELGEKLYGGKSALGRRILLQGNAFRIVGVLGAWRATPQFYDVQVRDFAYQDHVFLPFTTFMELSLPRTGISNCWPRGGGGETAEQDCAWVQYWVQLDSPAKADSYRQYLRDYSEQQRRAGRFERPTNVRLRDVTEWLDYNRIVGKDVKLQAWMAGGLLLLCLVNAVGLLLAKFLHRGQEIGVRRALGASQGNIFWQYMVECAGIGLAGVLPGIALASLGLWIVRQLPGDYAKLAQLDWTTLAGALALAVIASLAAGLLPAWRASRMRYGLG